MGIYDREYARDRQPGIHFRGDRTMVTNIMLVTGGVFLLQLLAEGLTRELVLRTDLLSTATLTRPWHLLGVLTYGFLHSTNNIQHILFNMLAFWFFARPLEGKFGGRELLNFYLTGIVVSGLVWLLLTQSSGGSGTLIGASGGVAAVIILFVFYYPKQTVLMAFVIPMPAWVFGIIWFLSELSGLHENQLGDGSNIAYTCHLGGAAYALLYYQTRWTFARWWPTGVSLPSFKRRPKLRVHHPTANEEQMDAEVDRILAKIRDEGQDSLTSQERSLLERASRRYQQKHR